MFTISKLYPPFRRNEELSDLDYEAYEDADIKTDVVDSSVVIRWLSEGEESEGRFKPNEIQPSCYVLGTSPRVATLVRQFCTSDLEKGDDSREVVRYVHRAIMEIQAQDQSILNTIGQVYVSTLTKAVIVVCDNLVPDELAFKWAEAIFGTFDNRGNSGASGEIRQPIPVVILDAWVGDKANSAFVHQGAPPGKEVDLQVIVSSATPSERMKQQSLDQFPWLQTPVLLSGASAAVISRSKGCEAVLSGQHTALAYDCVCFLAMLTWAADCTVQDVLKDAFKYAAFELLPKGVMNYSQDGSSKALKQHHSSSGGGEEGSLTVVEEFQRHTEGHIEKGHIL